MELTKPNKPISFRRMSDIFGNGKNTNSRNSRDIHKYMNVKTQYSKWIDRRIESLGAEENIDFSIVKNDYVKKGDFEGFDYIVTDDFAKHLGMVEKNTKGKEVRDYFIYMEKLANYLMRKTIIDCEIKTTKTIARKDKTIKELKSSRYAKPRTGDFQTVDRIRQDYNINLSTHDLNEILEESGILINKPILNNNYLPNEENNMAIRQGKTTLVYEAEAIAIFDLNDSVIRDDGYLDKNPTLI